MIDSHTATFLFCGALFVLSFATIGVFWLFEWLRGGSAPTIS
jgi:hypothetical protein